MIRLYRMAHLADTFAPPLAFNRLVISDDEAASVAGGEVVDSTRDPPRVVAFRSLPRTRQVSGCVLMDSGSADAKTRDRAYIALQVVGDRPARTDAPPRLWARGWSLFARPHSEEREMMRTNTETAPGPLAAERLVADYACGRDPWVKS